MQEAHFTAYATESHPSRSAVQVCYAIKNAGVHKHTGYSTPLLKPLLTNGSNLNITLGTEQGEVFTLTVCVDVSCFVLFATKESSSGFPEEVLRGAGQVEVWDRVAAAGRKPVGSEALWARKAVSDLLAMASAACHRETPETHQPAERTRVEGCHPNGAGPQGFWTTCSLSSASRGPAGRTAWCTALPLCTCMSLSGSWFRTGVFPGALYTWGGRKHLQQWS